MTRRRPRHHLGRARWLLVAAVAGCASLTLGPGPVGAADGSGAAKGELAIDTVVGTGDPANTGDGGPARHAGLVAPVGVATGPDGALYVLAGLQVRAVDPDTKEIRTIAGTGRAGFTGDGGPATEATFSSADAEAVIYGANALEVGSDGTVYIADTGNHRIRAIDPDSGTIRTVAGTGPTGDKENRFGGEGGKATKAQLFYPKDVAVDDDGNLYIADYLNYRVRMVNAETGRIRTIAGRPHPGDSGSAFFAEPGDEDAKKATKTFVEPETIAVDDSGLVYFSEQSDDTVRAVDPAKNTIETVAGRGTRAHEVNSPTGLTLSADGATLYIAGNDPFATDAATNRVFRLDVATGKARTYVGGAEYGALGDGGKPTDAYLGGPGPSGTMHVATGPDGELYVTDSRNNRIRMVAEATHARRTEHRLARERIDTLVGSGRNVYAEDYESEEDGAFYRDVHALDDVDLDAPSDVVVADDGTLYLADTGNNRIRTVDPDEGVVRTLAGRPDTPDYGETDFGDGGDATEAYLDQPRSLALGPDNRLYFANDTGDAATLRYVDLDDGKVDTVLGSLYEFVDPSGLAFDRSGYLYVVDAAADRICRMKPAADECRTILKDDPNEYGEQTDLLQSPTSLAIGPDDALYVGVQRQVLRYDRRTKELTTFVGYPTNDFGVSGDGGSAYSAELGYIRDLWVHGDTLYLADKINHRVRAVDLERHVIRQVAGTGEYEAGQHDLPTGISYAGGGYRGDGGQAGKAELREPAAVATGPDGELYVVDGGNRRVRVIGETSISPGVVVHPLLVVAVVAAVVIATGVPLYVRRRWRRRDGSGTTALATDATGV